MDPQDTVDAADNGTTVLAGSAITLEVKIIPSTATTEITKKKRVNMFVHPLGAEAYPAGDAAIAPVRRRPFVRERRAGGNLTGRV
jgi:multisubunit Na+/H+ antiporter MnhE subunit